MAVSKLPLGLNARNYLYIRPLNRSGSKKRADDKLLTKKRLLRDGIPTTGLIAAFASISDVRAFDWEGLRGDFVLKPARGHGGEGIVVVRQWNGASGRRIDGSEISFSEIEAEAFSIIDGAYSLDGLADTAFLEERVAASGTLYRLAYEGMPDIRVIVCKKVPVMAMLRLPTSHSRGKANLHQGALGIGIDLRTGITTKAVFRGVSTSVIPGTRTKVQGIKIPQWDTVLSIATRAQVASGLGYAGVDVVVDDARGPLVLEINARPGLQIQLANGASLRTRLERIEDMEVPTTDFGIDLARRIFAEHALADISSETNILSLIENVIVTGQAGKKIVRAKVDTGARRSSIDAGLADELGLELAGDTIGIVSSLGNEQRPVVRLTFQLRGRKIQTTATRTDRARLQFPMIIGRNDLKGFLVDPIALDEDIR